MSTATPRRSRRRTRLLARAATLGVAGLALAGAPAALAATAPSLPTAVHSTAVSTTTVSAAQRRATLAYWTPARRAAAIPADIISVDRPTVTPHPAAFRAGTPSHVAGGAPAGAATALTTASDTPPDAALTPSLSYPYPYFSFNVPLADYTHYPYRLNGWIYFHNNGGDYVCSGTSVASYHGGTEEDEVWTAGHCVANTNQSSPGVWDSYAEFVPAYDGTASDWDPYGVFVATRYSTSTNWLEHGDISVDEGAMEVGTNAAGHTLGQAVGWSGFAWNYSSNESFVAFGYPAAAPYTGNYMVQDDASTASSYSWPGGSGQPLIGIGNPMTGGSSGGAWNIDWNSSSGGYIDGHNDYKFYAQPNAVYSPYQDSLSNTVRCFGASSC
jgi:hypothetical protein